MDRDGYDGMAIVAGGVGLVLAALLATVELIQEGYGLAALPLIAVIGWREYAHAGMRAEIQRLRANR